jgi:hypothetical protein
VRSGVLGEHTIVQGTVLPAGASLYLCADVAVCRDKLGGEGWSEFIQQLRLQQRRGTEMVKSTGDGVVIHETVRKSALPVSAKGR